MPYVGPERHVERPRSSQRIDTNGARFADITASASGLITRGVLLDVPRYRRASYVTAERPVEGTELAAIAQAQGVAISPATRCWFIADEKRLSWRPTATGRQAPVQGCTFRARSLFVIGMSPLSGGI